MPRRVLPGVVEPPASASATTFDLTAPAALARRRSHLVRLLYLLPGLVLVGVGGWFTLPPYPQSMGEAVVIGVILAAAGAGMVVLGVRQHVPHLIDGLTLTPDSLGVHETDGTRAEQRWSDPDFGLTLTDPSGAGPSRPNVWLQLPNGGRGPVPRAVAQTVVREAAAHGLPVLVRPERSPTGSAEVTRVGRPERSPGWRHAIAAPSP